MLFQLPGTLVAIDYANIDCLNAIRNNDGTVQVYATVNGLEHHVKKCANKVEAGRLIADIVKHNQIINAQKFGINIIP